MSKYWLINWLIGLVGLEYIGYDRRVGQVITLYVKYHQSGQTCTIFRIIKSRFKCFIGQLIRKYHYWLSKSDYVRRDQIL